MDPLGRCICVRCEFVGAVVTIMVGGELGDFVGPIVVSITVVGGRVLGIVDGAVLGAGYAGKGRL